MTGEIRIENIGEGIEEVFIVSVGIKEGDRVKEGEKIGEAETYKAAFDLESDLSGVVASVNVEPGTMYPLPVVICSIEPDSGGAEEPLSSSTKIMATPRAKRLMRERGIDPGSVADHIGGGKIEEKDVLAFIDASKTAGSARSVESSGAVEGALDGEGRLDRAFIDELIADLEGPRAFFSLPSDEKVSRLRSAGAVIGEGVILGYGAGIVADLLRIGGGVILGRNTILRGERITIDDEVIFEEDCRWTSRNIRIGEYSYIAAGSKVGWGGEWNPEASVSVGAFSHIGEEAMLNPSRPVVIEDEVSVGAGTKIYTHMFWQSVLDGYTALHEGVGIERNVQVGANVVILPGTRIGEGITVGANSLLLGKYDGPGLVQGNPAKVVRKGMYPRQMAPEEKAKKAAEILDLFAGRYGLAREEESLWLGKKTHILLDRSNLTVRLAPGRPGGVDEGVVFDLTRRLVTGKGDERADILREFLRKYGIRFKGRWRYSVREEPGF